jgi:hypothetical protein
VSAIITKFVQHGVHVNDPTLPSQDVKIRATDDELDQARARFADAALAAEKALSEIDEGTAAVIFGGLLGKNGDDEIVFPCRRDSTRTAQSVHQLW